MGRGVTRVERRDGVKARVAAAVFLSDTHTQATAGHSRNGRLWRRIQRIDALPKAKQRALLQIIDAFIEKHARSS